MQMTLVHRCANEFCLVEGKSISLPAVEKVSFATIYKFSSAFLISLYKYGILNCPSTSLQHLIGSLINGLVR